MSAAVADIFFISEKKFRCFVVSALEHFSLS